MSKTRIDVYDLPALEQFAPRCVETVTVKKPVMANIRVALKAMGEVPGVRVVTDAQPSESEASGDDVTEFHRKLNAKG